MKSTYFINYDNESNDDYICKWHIYSVNLQMFNKLRRQGKFLVNYSM